MAEQVSTPSITLDKLQEQLTCPVCLSQFDSPKTLPCLHSFCLKCIQQLPVDLEKGKHVISCPTCRKTAKVPNKGPADLPTAFVINSLVEIQEQLKKLSAKGKQISCDNCSEGDATSYCKQCAIGFCEKCLAMHNGLKAHAAHQIMDMKDFIITASPVKEEAIMNCTDHNEPLKVFCETCQIQVGGINIDSSPVSLDVVPSPEMRGKPVKIVARINRPHGVAVDKKEQLIVAENGSHCITVYDKEGNKVRSFGSYGTKEGQFFYPYGVAVTNDGHIIVTDEHRLQKLTPEGCCVMSVGSSEGGSGPLQFHIPMGISVHPTTGQIFVADHSNHRIQVINGDFTYSHSIGSEGTAPGQLNNPWDVALDGVGNVYVANSGNHCIDVFTSDGKYLRRFGSRGSGDGQLSLPSSITIDTHNMVYIAEWSNHRISVFTTDGVFIQHIGHQGSGEGEFNSPYGITVDMLGNLYVSCNGNNRVVITNNNL